MRWLFLSLFTACVLDTSGLDFSAVSTGGTTVSASGGGAGGVTVVAGGASTGGASTGGMPAIGGASASGGMASTGGVIGTGGMPVPPRVCELALPQCPDCDQPNVLAGCVGVSSCWQVVDACGVRCKKERPCQ